MRLVFTGYNGVKSKLSKKDQEYLSPDKDLWIDIPLSPSKKAFRNKHIHSGINLRGLLHSSYPGCRFLHELASESVKNTRKYPTSSIVRTAQEDLEEESHEDMFSLDPPPNTSSEKAPPKGNKILLKTKPPQKTVVGQFQPRATLRNPIKGRKQPS